MSDAERIAELEAQLAESKAAVKKAVTIKMGNKQNVCVYGLGQRFPVTLYAPGWVLLQENMGRVMEFIEENKDQLSWER